MWKFFLNIIIFIFFQSEAQILHHEMLSAHGGTSITSNGYNINFTVGQQSVAGTFTNGYIVQQGFQQNVRYRLSGPNKEQIAIKLFPNPFVETIIFSFSKPLNYPLKLSLFDLLGIVITEKNNSKKHTRKCYCISSISCCRIYCGVV